MELSDYSTVPFNAPTMIRSEYVDLLFSRMKMSLSGSVPFVSFTPSYHHVVSFIQRCVYRRSGCRRGLLQRSAVGYPLTHFSLQYHPLLDPVRVPGPLAAEVDSLRTREEVVSIPA